MEGTPQMNNFNIDAFITCAEELLRADETIRALHLLDNLPAYYRDHIPIKIVDLKNEIYKRLSTPQKYINGTYELSIMDLEHGNKMEETLRGKIIVSDVKSLNDDGLIPHIIDYGPGEYWLPIILKKLGLKFTYQDIGLNKDAHNKALHVFKDNMVPPSPDQPSIFVAYEIIEHLWDECEIKAQMLFNHGLCDLAHISTPCYTFDIDCTNWRQKDELGHLRAYTPSEFTRTLQTMFPEYITFLYSSRIMQMRMTKRDTKFETIQKRAVVLFEDL